MDILSDEDMDIMFDITERIMDLQEEGKEFSEDEVQQEVIRLHDIIAKGLSKFIILLESSLMYIEADSKMAEVKKLHNFLNDVNLYKEAAKIGALRKMGTLFGSKAYKQMIDKGDKEGSVMVYLPCNRNLLQ